MKKPRIFGVVLVFAVAILAGLPVKGQSHHDRFEALFQAKDTTKLEALLIEWEHSSPDDPELYTSAINFYFYKSRQGQVSLDKEAGRQGLQLTDSGGKVVGYLNNKEAYRPDQLSLALIYIDRGIERFPNRLDMRFGKCYVLQQIADYDNFTTEVIKTVEYSKRIDNNWLWTNNKKLDNGRKFMLETIQEYLKRLYDTENDSLLPYMKRIGEATIRFYPDKVEILSTTAVANMLLKNYDTAIAYLHLAEKVNPKDFIVLNNLAQGYKMKGDIANAIKYYELTEKYGDEEAKQRARQNLKELRQ